IQIHEAVNLDSLAEPYVVRYTLADTTLLSSIHTSSFPFVSHGSFRCPNNTTTQSQPYFIGFHLFNSGRNVCGRPPEPWGRLPFGTRRSPVRYYTSTLYRS